MREREEKELLALEVGFVFGKLPDLIKNSGMCRDVIT